MNTDGAGQRRHGWGAGGVQGGGGADQPAPQAEVLLIQGEVKVPRDQGRIQGGGNGSSLTTIAKTRT